MINNNPVLIVMRWLISFILLLALNVASAEDTDIFADEIPPSKPNILFLLDQSGSMNINITGTPQSRLDVLKGAYNNLLSDPKLVDVNIGLMGFSNVDVNGNSIPYPHGVSFPITPIDDEAQPIMLRNLLPFGSSNSTTVGYFTLADDNLPDPVAGEKVRAFLPRILNGWKAWGNTPIVDAYHEAALYFRGEPPKWGMTTPEQNHAAHPSTYRGSSQGTVTQVLTGIKAICAAPDCGVNCTEFTEQDICPTGDQSCGLGTNCSTTTEMWGEPCSLGNEADCMASDPRFTSCTTSSNTTCSNSCISGVYHPETGNCIPDALNSFTIKTGNGAHNMCLEFDGVNTTQQLCSGANKQVFYTTEARPGYVHIHDSTDRCFDVTGSSNDDGTRLNVFGCKGDPSGNQVFQISGGQISADHSGKCMDVRLQDLAIAGIGVAQYNCNGLNNQSFLMSNEATACSTSSDILCQYPQETTRCDHRKYSCDETSEAVSLDSTKIAYISPITDKCENNAIVILSDGEPIVNVQAQLDQTMADIKAMAGLAADCVGTDAGRCGAELAKYLATQDQNSRIDGDNLISTYTIGFDVPAGSSAETFLTSVAKAGDGSYFPASNAAALTAVFKAIISDVSKTARSYAAPVYTVDPSSRLANSRDIYIPLFENSAAPRWSGNIKKFKLNDRGQIIGKNGKVAVSANGVLDPEAPDFWSTTTANTKGKKANPVTSGGAANLLVPSARNLLTDNNQSLVTLDQSSASKRALEGGGAGISDALYTDLLKYIKGYKDDGKPRHHIGDILHSKPSVVSYSDQEIIFFGTNEGYLHAINAADASTSGGGKELFAFLPSPLLANIRGQYENTPLTGPIKRIYGIDGEMTVWMSDTNSNGKIDPGEKAYLYFGLRRGGSTYYALDISDPTKPRLLWTIDNKKARFNQLGQTWSKPTLGKLRYKESGTVKFEEVLVFGGGYDATVYDEKTRASRPTGNVKGNSIYIVNAKTGKHIWSHTGGELTDSVPSSIRVLDVNQDGSIDRLYFGDTGGNVWRVDLNIDDSDDDASVHDVKKDARLYKFAALGQNNGNDVRKFFHEPEVASFKHKGRYISLITIGSGYRAHPKTTNIEDRLFVLYDEHTSKPPEIAPRALTESDLAQSSVLAGDDFLPNYKGWYKNLVNGKGEKSLSSPLIFMNKVMFTTFGLTDTPTKTGGRDSCTSQTNDFSRAYALNLMTGSATADLDGDGTVTDSDESVVVGFGEIPDSPRLVFNKPSNCTKDGCDHIVDVRVGKMESPLIDGNTVDGNVNLGEYLPKVFWLNSLE